MKKLIWLLILVLVIIVIILGVRQCGHGKTVVSHFNHDDEGWLVSGDAQGGDTHPDFMKKGGKNGAYISAKDDAVGGVWYWSAPDKFFGDLSSSYGKKLKFSLKQSSVNDQFDDADIILKGAEMTLVYDTPNNPGTDWTDYVIILTEEGWHYNNTGGDAVTKEDFQKVLKNVKNLYIRGEFVNGEDTDGLDEVVLEK